jgi:hypothetical protein
MIEANKWIDMAEDADEEKELHKIINGDFKGDTLRLEYSSDDSLSKKDPNLDRFSFTDDEDSENEDSENEDSENEDSENEIIKQDKTFKKPIVVN